MRLEKSFLILITMIKGIKNNICNKIKKNYCLTILIIFFILLGVFIAYEIFSPMLDAIVNGNNQMFLSFISSSMFNITLITFIIFLILINYNNENDNYNRMLSWAPLSKIELVLAKKLLEITLIFFINIVYITFFHLPSLVQSNIKFLIIFGYLCLANLQSLIIYLILNIFYLLLCKFLHLFSNKKIIKEIASIILGISSFIYLMKKFNLENIFISDENFKISLFNIILPISELFTGSEYFNNNILLISVFFILTILFIGSLLILLFSNIEFENRNLNLFKFIPEKQSKFMWIFLKELKQIIRSDTNISNLIVLVSTIISLSFLDLFYIKNSLINLFIASFSSIFALSSFGEDTSLAFFSNIMPISNRLISYGKLLGNIIISFLVYLILYLIISFQLGFDISILGTGSIYVLVGVIVVFSYGILIPIREKEPFSNITVFISFTSIIILFSILISYFTTHIYEIVFLLTIIDLIILPILYKYKSSELYN